MTCPLDNQQPIPGDGPTPCDWMFVGEAPGAEEERKGVPFVGAAGRLFDRLLEEANLSRSAVFVTNVERFRPPGNRTPKKAEIVACLPVLEEEIEKVQPKAVVTLGATALKVFAPKASLTSEHGKARIVQWSGRDVVLVPWYHPAAALHDPRKLPVIVADCQKLLEEAVNARKVRFEPKYGGPALGEVLVWQREFYGLDTETTSPERGGVFQVTEAELVGFSVSFDPLTGCYFDKSVLGSFRKSLEDRLWPKVLHNAKFEIHVLRKQGITLRGFHDTKIAAYLLNEPATDLKSLARQHLGVYPTTFKELLNGRKDIREVEDQEAVAQYAAADADNTRRLWVEVLEPKLKSEGLWEVYEKIELPLVPVLARMEEWGVLIDEKKAVEELGELGRLENKAGDRALARMSRIFNLASHDQLSKALEELGAPIKKRTPGKGLLVTDADSLLEVRDWNAPLIDALLDRAKYQKLRSYVENFLEMRGEDGRVRASFNQAGTWEDHGTTRAAPRTGRLSSSGPNLQNIPHHSDDLWGRRIRSLIVAGPGRVLVACDVGQEEPRIIAQVADDRTLRDDFESGTDIYRKPTESIYQYTRREELSDGEWKKKFEKERFVGKTFFLAYYYGAGPSRLRELDPSVFGDAGARIALRSLDRNHPARGQYLERVEEEAKRDGFVRTLFGRKIWVPEIWSPQRKVMLEGLRKGANGIVQGTGADIMKMALVKIDEGLRGIDARLCLTVHDEVVVECEESAVEGVVGLVKEAFQGYTEVELPVECRVGVNWGDMVEV